MTIHNNSYWTIYRLQI